MQPAVILREKLAGHRPVLGILITHHLWLDVMQIAIDAGLDYVIIDAEHLDHGGRLMADVFDVGRLANFPVLLRPPSTDTTALRLAMDLGPCGLLLPMIESAQQLDAAREGIYLPPRGQRRPGGPANRWLAQYNYDTFRGQVEDTLIVIPQIESPPGVENATAIARHPLVTAVGVGPFDLSARLGVCGDMKHANMVSAVTRIRQAADAAGKLTWMIGNGPALLAEGFRFLCVAEPTLLLQSSLKQLVSSMREAASDR